MKTESWKDKGILLALAAVWGICAAANTGMAWFDYGIVRWFNAAATVLYIVTATVLILMSWRKPVWAKFLWRFAWLSLICCLVCWYCSLDQRAWGLLFAPLAGIPFYGLRMWTNWQLTYLGGGAISAVWVLLAWRGVRIAGGRDAGVKAMLVFLAKTTGLVVLCIALFFVNAFAGNPVSALLARVAAHRYVAQEYGWLDVRIEKVGYDLKGTNYYAKVSSPTSVDTHFSVHISMLGQVERDTYESVTNKHNTFERLNREYYDLVKSAKTAETFPYELRTCSGGLWGSSHGFLDYGLPREELVLDGVYDMREIGAMHGGINVSVTDEDVSISRGCEILKDLAGRLERGGVSFYAVDFTLSHPVDKEKALLIVDFPAEYLNAPDLEEKLRENYMRTMEYYGEEIVLK